MEPAEQHQRDRQQRVGRQALGSAGRKKLHQPQQAGQGQHRKIVPQPAVGPVRRVPGPAAATASPGRAAAEPGRSPAGSPAPGQQKLTQDERRPGQRVVELAQQGAGGKRGVGQTQEQASSQAPGCPSRCSDGDSVVGQGRTAGVKAEPKSGERTSGQRGYTGETRSVLGQATAHRIEEGGLQPLE